MCDDRLHHIYFRNFSYEITKKGELRAGERLVITMIDYDGPIEMDFVKSHAWEKMKLVLLIYYCRNKQLNSNLLCGRTFSIYRREKGMQKKGVVFIKI